MCEYRGGGSKRAPVSREYASALERRVALLESFLSDLKSAPTGEKTSMIDGINLIHHLPSVARTSFNADMDEINSDMLRGRWEECGEGMILLACYFIVSYHPSMSISG